MNNSYEKFINLKKSAGLHSPSIFELRDGLGIDIKVDACFLCNPYAFDLFIENYKKNNLNDYIKYYPPQNKSLSKVLSKFLGINPENLLVGNGAIQIIELLLKEFAGKKKCIITPTFSTYYEFDIENIHFFKTYKENNFHIDKEKLIDFCNINEIEVLIMVNPNNPTGVALTKNEIEYIISKISKQTIVIIDESFIDFYDKNQSLETKVKENQNIIIIRSLSKDFGIAGLRIGYGVCDKSLIEKIKNDYGLCWNINGIAHFFLELLSTDQFMGKYKIAKEKYLEDRKVFYDNLKSLVNFKVYESNGNFFIIDCFSHVDYVFETLLFNNGVYTRILNDKMDLDNSFLRIACGSKEDNEIVFNSLKTIDKNITSKKNII